jgi:4-methyl-5(b-hydroxyethyl)-thiazole monophosphate biosynthesis
MSKTALLPIADGFEEIEALSIIDVLRRAEINVKIASLMNSVNGLVVNSIKIILI